MDIKKTREDLRKGTTIYDMPLRVCYYARVSTDKDDQLNSLENQQKYFEDYINDNKNWINVGGYIDEGISGTAVKNRDSFLRMIEDATYGKIDLVLTKEISRFSRNTVDSIKYTEYLLKQGVCVYFLSDNLNTIQEDAEFRLTIMASMAQDEVRKLSERVKFGVNRMIKDGKLVGGNLTGYYKRNGRYEINPNEAPIIKYLFETYASGTMGLKKIGDKLYEQGYKNSKGNPYSQTTLAKFLTNPRYKGYYTARLTEVEDYKTHKKKKVPKDKQIIYKDDKIPAIVSEDLWNKANLLHEKRKKLPARNILNSEKHIEKYKYSCKLFCKHCGAVYIRNGGSTRKSNPDWTCKTYRSEGLSKCQSPHLKEEYLDKIFIDIISSFIKGKKDYMNLARNEYKKIIEHSKTKVSKESIIKKIEVIETQKDKLLDLSIKGMIDDFEFKKRNDKFNKDIALLNLELENENSSNIEMNKLDSKLKLLDEILTKKLNIKDNLSYLINILIDRVEVEKVNNNRKHVRLKVYFDFKTPVIDCDLDFSSRSKYTCMSSISSLFLAEKSRFDDQNCTIVDTKQPRLCRIGK